MKTEKLLLVFGSLVVLPPLNGCLTYTTIDVRTGFVYGVAELFATKEHRQNVVDPKYHRQRTSRGRGCFL